MQAPENVSTQTENPEPWPDTPYDPIIHGAPPVIDGQPAIWDERHPILETFTHWRCPVCEAHLAESTLFGVTHIICLNACHLGTAGQARFQTMMSRVMGGSEETKEQA